jgi:hypothetical protein
LRALIVALLQFPGVFSDTLMFPLFTLPLIVYPAYLFLKQRRAAEAEKKKDGKRNSRYSCAYNCPVRPRVSEVKGGEGFGGNSS